MTNPTPRRRHIRVHTWILGSRTSNAPRHNTHQCAVHHQRSTRITLTRISAHLRRTKHARRHRLVHTLVLRLTFRIVDDVHESRMKTIVKCAAKKRILVDPRRPVRLGMCFAPAAHHGRCAVVNLIEQSGQCDRLHRIAVVQRCLQLQQCEIHVVRVTTYDFGMYCDIGQCVQVATFRVVLGADANANPVNETILYTVMGEKRLIIRVVALVVH